MPHTENELARLALIMYGIDATAKECNDFLGMYFGKVNLSEDLLKNIRDEWRRLEPAQGQFSKEGRMEHYLLHLLHSEHGKRVIERVLGGRSATQNQLKLELSIDMAADPPKVNCKVKKS